MHRNLPRKRFPHAGVTSRVTRRAYKAARRRRPRPSARLGSPAAGHPGAPRCVHGARAGAAPARALAPALARLQRRPGGCASAFW